MNSFSKATYGLLHKNTLLENEVAQLRKANHLLSKRRRTKNKQLQSGGSLTVQDGIALQVANDGDEAVGVTVRKVLRTHSAWGQIQSIF